MAITLAGRSSVPFHLGLTEPAGDATAHPAMEGAYDPVEQVWRRSRTLAAAVSHNLARVRLVGGRLHALTPGQAISERAVRGCLRKFAFDSRLARARSRLPRTFAGVPDAPRYHRARASK